MEKFRVVAWIPIDDDNDNKTMTLDQARCEQEHLQLLHPDNIFTIECLHLNNEWRQLGNGCFSDSSNQYRVKTFIRVEPDDSIEPYEDYSEAVSDLDQAVLMQCENVYQIERQNSAGIWQAMDN
jgi:hypothetical protein